MTDSDTPHRYREQRSQIAELSRLAMGQARLSDRLARLDGGRRRDHLLDFDRMARIVRMGAAFIVRLDQANEGKLRTASERTERFERRAAEAVERAEPPETRLTPLPGLPNFDVEPMTAEPPEPPEAAEPAAAPQPPRPQWEIAREALRQRRQAQTAGPAPPLRRSG